MKRKIVSILLALILVFSCTSIASANDKDVPIIIDGVTLQTDNAPFLYEGTTMVPMRSIFEALGATVEWNNETKSITARKGLKKIDMANLKYEITVNNITSPLLLPPALLDDGITYVPARAVAEALDATVEWKDGNVIVTSNTTGYEEYPTVPDFGKMFNIEGLVPVITEGEMTLENSKAKFASYNHLYTLVSNKDEYIKKYKETLLQSGFKFAKTEKTGTNADTITTYYYNPKDKSGVNVLELGYVVGISIAVPLSLDDLNLKATDLNLKSTN